MYFKYFISYRFFCFVLFCFCFLSFCWQYWLLFHSFIFQSQGSGPATRNQWEVGGEEVERWGRSTVQYSTVQYSTVRVVRMIPAISDIRKVCHLRVVSRSSPMERRHRHRNRILLCRNLWGCRVRGTPTADKAIQLVTYLFNLRPGCQHSFKQKKKKKKKKKKKRRNI